MSAIHTDHSNHNGAWQGAMVWMVAIPLLLYILVGGLGSLVGNAAGSSLGARSAMMNGIGTSDLDRAQQATLRQSSTGSTSSTGSSTDATMNTSPQNVEATAGRAARGAWGTLISMILALVAAAVGGTLGVRKDHVRTATA